MHVKCRRLRLMTCLTAFLMGTVFSSTAQAECAGAVSVRSSDWIGTVRTIVHCPGDSRTPLSGIPRSGASAKRAETQTCNSPAGAPIVCAREDGRWNAERSCYVQRSVPGTVTADSPLGDREGIAMQCTTLDGNSYLYLAPLGEPAPPDPRVLAQTAISRMDLHAIRIGSFPQTLQRSPASLGVVGWNVWLWVDGASPETYGPVTKSAAVGGYTVTATAEVDEVLWDMGNGDTVTCGVGTPHATSSTKDSASPDCGYRYARDGRYAITATTHWSISWAGIGQSGVIPLQLSTSGELAIAEIQVLNVPVRQN